MGASSRSTPSMPKVMRMSTPSMSEDGKFSEVAVSFEVQWSSEKNLSVSS